MLVIIYCGRQRRLRQEFGGNPAGERESAGRILGTLAAIAIPITIGVSIIPIMNIVDVAIVMRRLQEVGFRPEDANALYGQLTGMAGPVINIPMALALSIALSMVPAVAAANSVHDTDFLDMNIRLGLRTATIIGVPCTLGIMILAEPLMLMFYPMQAASAAGAAPCLFILAAGVVFLAVAQTMAGILQGLGRPYATVISLGAGVAVKAAATYVLTGIPALNVQGAAIGSSLAFGVVGILNFAAVKKHAGTKFNFRLSVWKPLLSGAVMAAAVLAVYHLCRGLIGNSLATLLSVGAGVAVYGVMLLKSRAIEAHEIRLLPKGEKLAGLLARLRLI
jgi:stage V sporulation protein B